MRHIKVRRSREHPARTWQPHLVAAVARNRTQRRRRLGPTGASVSVEGVHYEGDVDLRGGRVSDPTVCPPGCGMCCTRIWMSDEAMARIRKNAAAVSPDVHLQAWLDVGYGDLEARETYWDSSFIVEHWSEIPDTVENNGGRRFVCDRLDSETRLCIAYGERPPVCRRFPWYGKEPTVEEAKWRLPDCCVFRGDVGLPVEPVPVTIGARP